MPGDRPTPQTSSLAGLERDQRRRLIRRSIRRVVISTLALVALYAVVPVAGESSARAITGLVVGLAAFVLLLGYQLSKIITSEHPDLRAIEALATAVPTLIVVFAFTYLALSRNDPANFTEPLSRIDAFYFATTTLSTVGFGDIAATTNLTRVIVTIQIVADVLLVVGLARVVLLTAKLALEQRDDEAAG